MTVIFGTAYVPAPSKAHPVILDCLLNHFVLPKYNWNKMQRRVRCSVGWYNSPALFLLALRTLPGNLVQSRCHQWLRYSKEEETNGTRSKCREVACIYSSQKLGITSRSSWYTQYWESSLNSEYPRAQLHCELFSPSSFFLRRCV